MIYSVENGDRGDIFVDGVEINGVLSFDSEKGEVLKLAEPLRVENGKVVTEVITGEKIEFVRY